MNKITIIIPVYNVEKYLRQCLDSVVNQTMRDLQIICVNDGSPDGSRAILQEYADKDSRIQIIDKENGGLSSARNAAYPYIKGKYTLFVDSDDWIDLQLCEKVYAVAEQTNAEMTMFFFHGDGSHKRWSESLFNGIAAGLKETIDEKRTVLSHCTAWSKLWRSDFLTQNQIMFPDRLIFEDNVAHWHGIVLAEKVAVVHERLYHYRDNGNGLEHSTGEKIIDIVEVWNQISDILHETGQYTAYKLDFCNIKWNHHIYHRYGLCADEWKPSFIRKLRTSITKDDKEFLRSNNCPSRLKEFYSLHFGTVREKMTVVLQNSVKLPERLLRNYVIKPLKRKFAA